jgi:hypothetical protein
VLKRFIAGEELIVRANFGYSSEVRFQAKRQQSCNYDDVAVMISVPQNSACPPLRKDDVKTATRKSPTDSLGRRFLASVGFFHNHLFEQMNELLILEKLQELKFLLLYFSYFIQ